MKQRLSPYYPGFILFFITLIIGLLIYKDYGVAWDEPLQRGPGVLSYNYAFFHNPELFIKPTDNHGAGFELLLIIFEKWMKLTDVRQIYLMRHIVTHLLFLIGALSAYILAYRLFKNKFLAVLGFLLIVCAPRIYAHSFFNSKDLPFLAMFIISLTWFQYAFEKNKSWPFFILGFVAGYGTSIRIMGAMLGCFILFAMLVDLVFKLINKEKPAKHILNIALFVVGFCFTIFIAWPYLWRTPWLHFVQSFGRLARFDWIGSVLLGGKFIDSTKLPWTYFFTWFFISNPIVWLVGGLAGMVMILAAFVKKPLDYIRNTNERNFMLYVACFIVPILMVLFLHSIIYDDWRHLYFIYPPFVMMILYAVHKVLESNYIRSNKNFVKAVQGACLLQIGASAVFMVQAHPFQQVYFNNLVSHDDEFLRKNYEMDYWGVSNYSALKYILDNDQRNHIMVTTIYPEILQNNIEFLDEDDRKRVQLVHPDSADYFITNFRFHPDDFPMQEEYSFKVLNSTVIRIYRMKNIGVRLK